MGYTIMLQGTELGQFEGDTPIAAAIAAHREYLTESREPVDGWTYAEHGPRWGGTASRSNGAGNGAQNLDRCLIAFYETDGDACAIIEATPPTRD